MSLDPGPLPPLEEESPLLFFPFPPPDLDIGDSDDVDEEDDGGGAAAIRFPLLNSTCGPSSTNPPPVELGEGDLWSLFFSCAPAFLGIL